MPELPQNKFHDHLDVCRQCRETVFDLCEDGEKLLREEANKIQDTTTPLSVLFKRPKPGDNKHGK